MNAGDCVALFIFYCDAKLILYRKALNNASQMAMRYRLLATLPDSHKLLWKLKSEHADATYWFHVYGPVACSWFPTDV